MRRVHLRGAAISTIVRRVVAAAVPGSSITFFTRPSSKLAEQTMKFESVSRRQRSRRSKSNLQAPATIESLEVRSLMTVLSPTGTVNDATPTFTWEAVDNATSYDLWVTDAESRCPQFIEYNIKATNFTPVNDLNLGRTRTWVRANFANNTSSDWSAATEFIVQVTPTVTGPVNPSPNAPPRKLAETRPTITWTSPPGAFRFEIFLSNQTELTSRMISVPNNTPILDADGNTQPDGKGDVLRNNDVESYTLTDDLVMGNYRVFVRSVDDGGRISAWSAAYDFEVAPPVVIARPVGGTFQNSHVIALNISGTPAAGSYSVEITTFGAAGRTFRTAMLPYNAPTPDVQAAVRSLKGFETTEVTTTGSSPNLTHRLHLPASVGRVTASVADTFNPGTVVASVINAPGILLQWEPVAGATHYEVWVSKKGAADELTRIHSALYLTTTSFEIPALLADGNYVFWVRAKRLHQVTEIKLTGAPESGSYRIVLTTFGKDGKTQQTGPISYNATAAQIRTAVASLEGFENVDVVAGASNTRNLTYLLQIPQTNVRVRVNEVARITPGELTSVTRYQPEVVGIWSLQSDFSTSPIPVITGPAGIGTNDPNRGIVTDARPTLEWMPIDNAARYDIWVEVSNGKSPYLRTTSSVNFYQFEQDIQRGKYTVWVRAVSTTGKTTAWSTPFSFEATGGAPIITSPLPNTNVLPIPNITWTSVPDANSYDIWIAWVGEDQDYIRVSNIAGTTFAPTEPLPTGSYRVWVRAVKTDGTTLPWSTPVAFTVALNDVEQSAGEIPELLAALLTTGNVQAESTAEGAARQSMDAGTSDVQADSNRVPIESIAMVSMPTVISAMTQETEGFIQQLAEECMSAEWWTSEATEI